MGPSLITARPADSTTSSRTPSGEGDRPTPVDDFSLPSPRPRRVTRLQNDTAEAMDAFVQKREPKFTGE
jgi:hypothetical protein